MSETPTPETDSVTRSSDETPWTPWVCAGHAKRLERERDEAMNFSKELTEKYLEASGKLQRERDEAKSIISILVRRRIILWEDVDSALEQINEEKEKA